MVTSLTKCRISKTVIFPFIGTSLKNSINIQQKRYKLTHTQLLNPSTDASFKKRLEETPGGSFLRNKQDLRKLSLALTTKEWMHSNSLAHTWNCRMKLCHVREQTDIKHELVHLRQEQRAVWSLCEFCLLVLVVCCQKRNCNQEADYYNNLRGIKSKVNHVISFLNWVELLNRLYFLFTVRRYGNGSLALRSPGLHTPNHLLLLGAVI